MTTSELAPGVEIRPTTNEDVAEVRQLILPFVEQRKLLPRSDAELLVLMQHGFVAVSGGRIVGFAALEIYSRKIAEVQCLAVAVEFQGQGLGKNLVALCVNRAREQRVREVMAFTSSEEFLLACGFDFSLPEQRKAMFVRTCND